MLISNARFLALDKPFFHYLFFFFELYFFKSLYKIYLEPEVAPLSLNGTNVTWTSFYLDWESIDPSFIPGVLRSYRVSYEIQDPGFHHAYDGFILVDSNETSTNLTGLIGLTNYKITVSGVTVKDGPVIEMYLQTKEGGKTDW